MDSPRETSMPPPSISPLHDSSGRMGPEHWNNISLVDSLCWWHLGPAEEMSIFLSVRTIWTKCTIPYSSPPKLRKKGPLLSYKFFARKKWATFRNTAFCLQEACQYEPLHPMEFCHPSTQKHGIFHTLLWSAQRICSTVAVYKKREENLTAVFLELGYPLNRLHHIAFKIDYPSFSPKQLRNNPTNLCLPLVQGVSKKVSWAWKTTARTHGLDLNTMVWYQLMSKLRRLLISP